MTSRPHRRRQHPSSDPGATSRIPHQRSSDDDALAPGMLPGLTPGSAPAFVSDDRAELVLHRVSEDPEFQRAVDELPLVKMVGEYLAWVGEGISPPLDEADQQDLAEQLEGRLGVHFIASSGVARRRAQVIAMACARMRLITTAGERLDPGPDRAGWTDPDPVLRTWLRSRVVAAVLECSVRFVAGEHVLGDEVRHALATMVAVAGEGQPCPLGLRSAVRPDDLAAEHVDRVVNEHVAELQALGLCAPGRVLVAAPGTEPVLRSVAVGLRAAPVADPGW